MSYITFLHDVHEWFEQHPEIRPPDTLSWNCSNDRSEGAWHIDQYRVGDAHQAITRELFSALDHPDLKWQTRALGNSYYINVEDHPVFGEVTIYLDDKIELPSPRLLLG